MTFLPLFSLFSMISWVIFRLLTLQKEGKKEKKETKYIAAYTPLWQTLHKRTVKDKKKKTPQNHHQSAPAERCSGIEDVWLQPWLTASSRRYSQLEV